MAVFRVARTKDYTVMSNYHLKDNRLSLKAKGLLSQMLSLPDNWDYTLTGLAKINRESKDAIRSAINELEAAGYVIRHQTTDKHGKFSTNEYLIYEHPPSVHPLSKEPSSGNPTATGPPTINSLPDYPTQSNTNKSNTNKLNTNISNTHINPSLHQNNITCSSEMIRKEESMSMEQIENYRALIYQNIEYDRLVQRYKAYKDNLDEIVTLIIETVCSTRQYTRIAGSTFPHEVVRSRFLKLNSSHIEYVMDCLLKNTTEIKNIKQYLMTVLFNAPTTMNNHYTAQVNHDMEGII